MRVGMGGETEDTELGTGEPVDVEEDEEEVDGFCMDFGRSLWRKDVGGTASWCNEAR